MIVYIFIDCFYLLIYSLMFKRIVVSLLFLFLTIFTVIYSNASDWVCRNYWEHSYSDWKWNCKCDQWYIFDTIYNWDQQCVPITDESFCWENWIILNKDKMYCWCKEWYTLEIVNEIRSCYSYDLSCKYNFWEYAKYSSWTSQKFFMKKFGPDYYSFIFDCECPVWSIIEWNSCLIPTKLKANILRWSKWTYVLAFDWIDWYKYFMDTTFDNFCTIWDIIKANNIQAQYWTILLWQDKIPNINDTFNILWNNGNCSITSFKFSQRSWFLKNKNEPANSDMPSWAITVDKKSVKETIKTSVETKYSCSKKWGIWNIKKKTCVFKKK